MNNIHINERFWPEFELRSDDVVAVSYPRSGMTWTQQIVVQLIFQGDASVHLNEVSPWAEGRRDSAWAIDLLRRQRHRRVIKSHLRPSDLHFSPVPKYLFVARDPRDMILSLHHYQRKASRSLVEAVDPSGQAPFFQPPPDLPDYFRRWLDEPDYPLGFHFFAMVRDWWELRAAPNVLLCHYHDYQTDLPGEVERIARFLGIDAPAALTQRVVEHCTFLYMKRHADRMAPGGGKYWEGGGQSFINQGKSGQWRGVLREEDVAAYERRARDELEPACARWLEVGRLASEGAAAAAAAGDEGTS